jgi:hypothetical protein
MVPYRISEPVDIPHLQRMLDGLEAEIAEREQAAAALAIRNAELYDELQQRLAESESFGRVVISLLQKTALEDVLDIVCAEAKELLGATGSAVLLLTDQAWLEVKHRVGQPLTAVDRLPVDGSLAGLVVRHGMPVLVNDPAPSGEVQVYLDYDSHRLAGPTTTRKPSWPLLRSGAYLRRQAQRAFQRVRLKDPPRTTRTP